MQPASFLRRLAALLYDSLLLLALLMVATALLLPFHHGEAFAPSNYLYKFYLLLVSFGFYGWFWTHGGQTLGMRAWRLRLTSQQGTVNWRQALKRFLWAIPSLFSGLGLLWALWDKHNRTLHGVLSETRLVRVSM